LTFVTTVWPIGVDTILSGALTALEVTRLVAVAVDLAVAIDVVLAFVPITFASVPVTPSVPTIGVVTVFVGAGGGVVFIKRDAADATGAGVTLVRPVTAMPFGAVTPMPAAVGAAMVIPPIPPPVIAGVAGELIEEFTVIPGFTNWLVGCTDIGRCTPPGFDGPRIRPRKPCFAARRANASVFTRGTLIDELLIGGFPAVPDDVPGVEVTLVGPYAGPVPLGSPFPGYRLVVQPNAARVAAIDAAAMSRANFAFFIGILRIWPPSVADASL
jgi:hypothetical protein